MRQLKSTWKKNKGSIRRNENDNKHKQIKSNTDNLTSKMSFDRISEFCCSFFFWCVSFSSRLSASWFICMYSFSLCLSVFLCSIRRKDVKSMRTKLQWTHIHIHINTHLFHIENVFELRDILYRIKLWEPYGTERNIERTNKRENS